MRIDILFTPTNDLVIETGAAGPDIVYGTQGVDERIVLDILTAYPGSSYKESPLLGVGIADYLRAPGDGALNRLTREASRQLLADGYKLNALDPAGDIDFELI